MISTLLSVVSLRDLTLVQAVCRHGSFNSAARAMHISPSGLSHQVQKVEQALGSPLFERGGRRIVPTAGGRRLLLQIDAVLAAAEHLQQAARAGAVAFGGELRLGVPVSLGPYLLPHLVDPFPQHFPGARLSLSEGKPRGLLRRLHEGELDAVLAPPSRPASGIAMRPLFFEPWELMLRADHPLAGRRAVALDQLDPGEAILMAESHADGLDGHGGHVQDVSLESLAALLGLRGGYALVPALARERLASMPGMVLVKIRGEAPGREIALYWREATPWHDDLQALAELLRKLARQRPGLRVA
ncbi:LysR family transcriptional regulator [Frateuria sp. Soil773]|uniref:LysR family transcriptional regulator n=1 Tax=Frateuria sp. Soil773 TaxID=1736407 RepID=UPI0006F87CFA|nr:LysR family transcriptional regulator [Frateuria sp. Soil773]KRE89187.1 LysR family transcriptional regulator [Frateuria sp. Soil773]